jgi:hypothetical protein
VLELLLAVLLTLPELGATKLTVLATAAAPLAKLGWWEGDNASSCIVRAAVGDDYRC